MKNIISIFLTCFSLMVFSQSDTITGSYSQSSNDPQGGTTFIILPNNTFVVAYFGGMRKGTWKLIENDNYEFTCHVEPKFVVYGRHNPTFKDSVAILMSIDGNKGFAVRFNKLKDGEFTPIFNKGANCFSYPYIYKQNEKLTHLEVYEQDFRQYRKGEIYNLPDIHNYEIDTSQNEFILTGLSSQYSEAGTFTATYKNGMLAIDGNGNLKKRAEFSDIDSESLAFIKQFTENELLPKVLNFDNEFFPNYDNPKETDLKPFLRIEPKLESSNGIKTSKTSLFVANCED